MTTRFICFMSIFLFGFQHLQAQNWTTHCGGNTRNGRSELPGPQSVTTPLWTVNNAAPTATGMNIYSFGNRFVTSRVIYSPYSAKIECRDLLTGTLNWTSPNLGAASILHAMGFNEDAVYAHDYNSQLFYALDPADGSVKWVSTTSSYSFGPMDGVIYTCDRDIIINGPVGSFESVVCLEKETGEIRWTNENWFAVTPLESKAALNERLYMIPGSLLEPKRLVAVDMATGDNLYYSDQLAGDGDQELPIAVSQEGLIVFRRDGGPFFAFQDNGAGFDLLWTYAPVNMSNFTMNYAFDDQGNVLLLDNGHLVKLNKADGSVLGSSAISTLTEGRITVGSDSIIYINSTNGKYYAISPDLQSTIWVSDVNSNYYAGPSLSGDGIMIMAGSGTTIKGYKYSGPHAPVADFSASTYHVLKGGTVNFTDQSAFSPDSWQWDFQGGTPATSSEQHPQDVRYDQAGIFPVKLVAANTSGTDTVVKNCYIEVTTPAGLTSEPGAGSIFLYPNPASGKTRLETDLPAAISILNSQGIMVYEDTTKSGVHTIDVTGWTEGVYLVKVLVDNRPWYVKLLVSR